MGGQATISVSQAMPYSLMIIEHDGDNSLGSSGTARASDGSQYAYLYGYGGTFTITFQQPVREFGAYWGAFTGVGWPDPANIGVSFFDTNGNQVDSTSFVYSHVLTGDGELDWHGWSSPIGVEKITVTQGVQVMMDGLQANVPEPASLALVAGLGLLSFVAYRRLAGCKTSG